MTETSTYKQMVAVVECRDCTEAERGKRWVKADVDGERVTLSAKPCEKHARMLMRLGWAPE